MTNSANRPMDTSLVRLLRSEITAWIEVHTALLTNERDIQVKIAKFLEHRQTFDNVFTEYRVPLSELKARGIPVEPNPRLVKRLDVSPVFPWNNQMSVDIVVEKDGQFAALELKYTTCPIAGVETLFDEPLLTDAKILKNQAASNLNMYNYWKDVRRIEMLTSVFKNVTGGIALMISNCHDYWRAPAKDAKYAHFSMHEGHIVGPGTMAWNGRSSDTITTDYPEFILSGEYTCNWHDTNINVKAVNGDKFRYIITEIN